MIGMGIGGRAEGWLGEFRPEGYSVGDTKTTCTPVFDSRGFRRPRPQSAVAAATKLTP